MKLPFDKIYCLHLTENKERYNNILQQFDKLNIENDIDIWYSVLRPFSTFIGDKIDTLHTNAYNKLKESFNENLYGSVFNVSMEFYTIIKQAYLRGFNSICLLEDDFVLKDELDYEQIFNNLPDDWDILRLAYSYIHEKWMKEDLDFINSPDFFVKKNWGFGGMHFIALNRKAMEYYINFMDDKFEYADAPIIKCNYPENKKYILNDDKLNMYVTKESIALVDNFRSTINENIENFN